MDGKAMPQIMEPGLVTRAVTAAHPGILTQTSGSSVRRFGPTRECRDARQRTAVRLSNNFSFFPTNKFSVLLAVDSLYSG